MRSSVHSLSVAPFRAIPTSAVQAIVDQLTTRGVAFGPELVQEETVRSLDGVGYTTFRVDTKKLSCSWAKDGRSRAIKLGTELNAVKSDLLASAVFNLALKCTRPRVADSSKATMAFKLEAVSVEVSGVAKEALDPEKAVANESWSEKVDRLGLNEERSEGDFGCG